MANELVAFLSRYMDLSAELEAVFASAELVRRFPKGAVLLRAGEIPDKSYFVLSGCLRSYVVKNGAEKTIDFILEEEAAIPLAYGTGAPAEEYLECLEATVAVVNGVEGEARMLAAHPELKEVCLAMAEIMAAKLRGNLARYKTSTPEERYRDLAARRPELLRRIPQYHIASYLGVEPESLSRIRRRLARPAGKGAAGKTPGGDRS
jgi:CRP-like cAMP-binding protein